MNMLRRKIGNVLARKRPIKYLAMRALKSSRLCLFFSIDRKSYRLAFHPSALSGELWYDPELRVEDERFFKRYLRPGDAVIDAGANIGDLTLQASVSVGRTGTVIAIEAHPRIFSYLVKNVDRNRAQNVQLHNCALGNADGTIHLSDGSMDDTNGVTDAGGNSVAVPLCRLDNLPIRPASIALLKVDVEGYERFVIEGSRRILQITKCVYFESWDENFRRFGYSSGELIAMLEDTGFTVYKLGEGSAVPVGRDHCSAECENLVAVRDTDDFFARTGFSLRPDGSPVFPATHDAAHAAGSRSQGSAVRPSEPRT